MTHAFDLRTRGGPFVLDARAAWSTSRCALFGASGSGKSTILEAIAGTRSDVEGDVLVRARRLGGAPPRARGLGWVPQDAALFPHLTARGNLAFAAKARGNDDFGSAADAAVEALEIGPLMDRRASKLSGGERQRVAIARALASRPSFLLLDEPLASIDRPLRTRIVPFLSALPERFDLPYLCVTHDPLEVLALTDHVLVLEAGRVVASGAPGGVFAAAGSFAPLHALGADNVFDVTVARDADDHPGTLTLRTRAGCTLVMAALAGFPAPSRVAVRAEDILLATEPPRGVSAQNVLAARVARVELLGQHVHVVAIAGGESFTVKVTARAQAALGVVPGQAVHLVIKAHAIVPCA